ncbi:chemotaxis protein CheW [Ferrimonas marina]|uniref:Purine-binding chemotaxis protein CheW n=1 Tax=Ferrimonas marina TaxID=299255 RepID=A0A1M5YED8_9GAMM|nr:chemotaxis protein CheW [Ferrimonas marina]SHI10312.1 purine-binding chemotaxis protein CheW [Ferrimonas marina]
MSRHAQQAVDEYFDVLLAEAEPEPEPQTAVPVHQARVADLLERAQAQSLTPEPEQAQPEPAVVERATPVAPPRPEATPVRVEPEAETERKLEVPTEPVLPRAHWRDDLGDEFQCLYFKVAGLTLAVPLQMLGGIKRVAERTKLPGQPPWMLGVQSDPQAQYYVVDSGRWLLPDRPRAQMPDYQYLVQLGESRWCLACESLVNAEPLKQAEVKWRNDTDQRRFMAGIVKKRMCVVLDVPELVSLLDAGLDINLQES